MHPKPTHSITAAVEPADAAETSLPEADLGPDLPVKDGRNTGLGRTLGGPIPPRSLRINMLPGIATLGDPRMFETAYWVIEHARRAAHLGVVVTDLNEFMGWVVTITWPDSAPTMPASMHDRLREAGVPASMLRLSPDARRQPFGNDLTSEAAPDNHRQARP